MYYRRSLELLIGTGGVITSVLDEEKTGHGEIHARLDVALASRILCTHVACVHCCVEGKASGKARR